ncbi:pseudouridine-5'-phosphate glycosidase [Planktomarina temperata]|nr:pseudouridine-5'-phosphate glycosidase [Planktomarina temperata]
MQLTYSAEIEAIRTDAGFSKPVVALESTIITHGMPYPQNLDVARAVEQEVRDAGAVPATIAILNGSLRIGLDPEQLTDLAQARDVAKVSRADMAFVMAQGNSGATTVAATMIAAQAAGIEVFATGGIGGVHRGADLTFDISADLRELALTDTIVVAAGAKAILDIPKTMEVLETYGVPVIAYGQDEMPAFWSQKSDIPAPLRCDTPQQIVAGLRARQALGLSGGQLIGNPVPKADEISAEEIGPMIELALHEAHRQGINAKAVTPCLLRRIFELTEGKSLQTNIALVKNNARLAAQIAKSCWELPKS